MHDGPVEIKKCGNLILVQCGPAAECGQDEAAGLRALGLTFELLPNRKIGGSQMNKNRIFQNVRWNQLLFDDDHRTVTVASSGLRHCGRSVWSVDFFPMAITITISWYRGESPRNLESLRPSNPSIGHVL